MVGRRARRSDSATLLSCGPAQLSGDWHKATADYYGACESIDASVGRVRKVLEEEGLSENTIFVFMSDHGCHFMTRNQDTAQHAQ